jgi:hypothetical protein
MNARLSSLCFKTLVCGLLASSVGLSAALTSGEWTYRAENNKATIMGYTGTGGAVVFPAEIEGIPVTRLERMFGESNNAVTSVEIPDSIESINCASFNESTALTSVSIGKGMTNLGYAVFLGCGSLTNIEVAPGNPEYTSLDGVLFSKDKTTLVSFPQGRSGTYEVPQGVTTILDDAFMGRNRLTGLKVPESVANIRDRALAGCQGLESLSLPAKFSGKLQDLGLGAEVITKLATPVSAAGGIDSLTVGNTTYENVRLEREYPSSLFIRHEGGTAFIDKAKLSEDQIASLSPAGEQ